MKKELLITSGIIGVGIIGYVIYKKQTRPRVTTDIGIDKDTEYLNFSLKRANPGTEEENNYKAAKTKFPYPNPGTCENLKKVIDQLALDIQAEQKKRATSMSAKGSGRPELYHINGYSKWKTELEQSFIKLNCAKQLEQKEQQEVFGTFTTQLGAAKADTEESDKMTTYVVFGMLGVVVLVSGLLILKRRA